MLLSKTFRSKKPLIFNKSTQSPPEPSSSSSSSSLSISRTSQEKSSSRSRSCLKQHNGELKGGAKASCAGRPWICACIVHGFNDQSEACKFESKWKSVSRKLPRKGKTVDGTKESVDDSHALLQHRQKALSGVKGLFDFNHLEIDWKLDPF
ncbi:nuclease, putative [Ricinus communis]|uniref:Nuclease, putative n=1 Tax=Ricinus communis TaxID=3988 RepID=B9SPM7_RICCO|nr:nuclease, putative [Ricinus communis]